MKESHRSRTGANADDFAGITGEDVTRLLGLALRQPHRPVDDVIDRLRQPDGEAWLAAALRSGPSPDSRGMFQALQSREVDLKTLQSMKAASKQMLKERTEPDTRTAPVLVYFLVIAAALARHGVLITSHTRDEVDEILIDL